MNINKTTDIRCSTCKQVLVFSSLALNWDDCYGEPHKLTRLSCGCDTWNARVPAKSDDLSRLVQFYRESLAQDASVGIEARKRNAAADEGSVP